MSYQRLATTIHALIALRDEERPAREQDWIDGRMLASIRLFECPLDTPSRRRLAASGLRRGYAT